MGGWSGMNMKNFLSFGVHQSLYRDKHPTHFRKFADADEVRMTIALGEMLPGEMFMIDGVVHYSLQGDDGSVVVIHGDDMHMEGVPQSIINMTEKRIMNACNDEFCPDCGHQGTHYAKCPRAK